MRLGWSLLLREHVAAEIIEHGDCADFQIVCPSCMDPVFKAGGTTLRPHYLSHYRADETDAAACGLRVASLARERLAAVDATGRGQRLALFQKVFRDAVARGVSFSFHPVGASARPADLGTLATAANGANGAGSGALKAASAPVLGALVGRMQARPYWRVLVRGVRDHLRAFSAADMAKVWGFQEEFFRDRSPFWRARQRRFAEDMLDHLLAPNSSASLSFLFASAALETYLLASEGGGGGAALGLDDMQARFISGSDKQLRRWVAQQAATPEPPCRDRLDAIMQVVLGDMLRILFRIPYLGLLRESERERTAQPGTTAPPAAAE